MADVMLMNEFPCNVVYIDPTATGANDGTTPADARTTFPLMASLVSNTVYLVRRSAATGLALPSGNRADLNNIFFLGMPLATDWIYSRVPAAAKAAWDADVATYSRVEFATYNSYLVLRPVIHAGVHRFHFVRMNPAGGHANQGFTYGQDYDSAWGNLHFQDTSAENNACYFFTNNKWSDDGIDLSNPGWVTNSTTFGGSIILRRGKALVFRDNVIDLPCSYNGIVAGNNWMYRIYLQSFERADVCNNTVWITSAGATSSNQYNSQVWQTNDNDYVEFINNHVKMLPQNYTNVSFSRCMHVTGFLSCLIKDCSVEIDRYYSVGTPTDARMFNDAVAIQRRNTNRCGLEEKSTIKNVSSNLGKLWYYTDGNACNMLIDMFNGGQAISAYTMDIGNISAVCDDTGGYGPSASGYGLNLRVGREANTISNIVAHHYQTVHHGLYLHSEDPNYTTNIGAVFKQVSVKGKLYVNNVPFMEITDIASPKINQILMTIYGSVVYIATATYDRLSWVSTNNWLDYDRHPSYGAPSQVFIDNLSLPAVSPAGALLATWNQTPDGVGGVWLNNVAEVAGNWCGSNRYYQGTTHSTYRQGGGAASIKLVGTYSDTRTPLLIGPRNFTGLQWTPPSVGAAYAKFFIAHVDTGLAFYTAPQKAIENVSKKVRAEVLVPWLDNDGIVRYRLYASNLCGMWEDDLTSVWKPESGDPGYENKIQRVCTIPFLVTNIVDGGMNALKVQFRLKYDLYGASGYTYLDPVIVFGMS
jgi:hypothetical protein